MCGKAQCYILFFLKKTFNLLSNLKVFFCSDLGVTQPQKPEGRGGFGLDSSSFMCDLLPKPPAAAEAPPDQARV